MKVQFAPEGGKGGEVRKHEHAMELRTRLLALLPPVHTDDQLNEIDDIVRQYGGGSE